MLLHSVVKSMWILNNAFFRCFMGAALFLIRSLYGNLVSDPFNYSLGSDTDITTVSGSAWTTKSSGSNKVFGTSANDLYYDYANSGTFEDVQIDLGGSYNGGDMLYYAFDFTGSTLRSGTQSYFYFQDPSGPYSRGRFYAKPLTSNTFQVGVGTVSETIMSTDSFNNNDSYRIVVGYQADNATGSKLWANNKNSLDSSIVLATGSNTNNATVSKFVINHLDSAEVRIDNFIVSNSWSEAAKVYTYNFDGSGTFSTATNWTENKIDSESTQLNFGSSISSDSTVTVNTDITTGNFNIDDNNNYTISPSSSESLLFSNLSSDPVLKIDNNNGNGAHTIHLPIVISNHLTVENNSNGNFTLTGNITNSNSKVVTYQGSGDTIISGSMSNGFITKAGSGNLIINNSSTHTGPTNINNGALYVNNSSGSGTGTGRVLVNNGGTLGGEGSFTGRLESRSGSFLSPGSNANSIGSLRVGLVDMLVGTYIWQLSDANDAGNSSSAGSSWDSISFSGTLDMSNFTPGQVTIDIQNLDGSYRFPQGANLFADSSNTGNHGESFNIMTGNITHFSASYFNLNSNGMALTNWNIQYSNGAIWLSYNAVPEASTFFTLLITLIGLIFIIIKRKFQKFEND